MTKVSDVVVIYVHIFTALDSCSCQSESSGQPPIFRGLNVSPSDLCTTDTSEMLYNTLNEM
jgi:hypothetical protein